MTAATAGRVRSLPFVRALETDGVAGSGWVARFEAPAPVEAAAPAA